MIVAKEMKLMGIIVRDRVTQFEGVVTSIGFDLFGCVQAIVTPRCEKPIAAPADSRWFDTSRLEVIDPKPVITLPAFCTELAEHRASAPVPSQPAGVKGGFAKPLFRGQ